MAKREVLRSASSSCSSWAALSAAEGAVTFLGASVHCGRATTVGASAAVGVLVPSAPLSMGTAGPASPCTGVSERAVFSEPRRARASPSARASAIALAPLRALCSSVAQLKTLRS